MTGQVDCRHRDFFEAEGHYICRICGKVLAEVGMTRITDASGTRWVRLQERKRRKPGRALRFANIKEGDILACSNRYAEWIVPVGSIVRFVVTDLWFDPVAGEKDQTAGLMVAIKMMRGEEPFGRKIQHTRRGLAMQGFHYADKMIAARQELAETISAQIETIRGRSKGGAA